MNLITTIYRGSLVGAVILLTASCVSWAASGKFDGLYFESKGNGKPVVLIHGGQMDRRMWDAQFDVFARHYRVIRYDIRGFGKSSTPAKPFSNHEDLHLLLRHLQVKKASLVGLSLGAALAVDFALARPDEVESLLLVCPGLSGFPFEDKANDLHAVIEAAQDENFDKAAKLWLANPYMSVAMENAALRDRLRQLARDNAHCWLNNPLLVRRSRPSAAERLREIRAPTLIIGGERDVSDIHKIVAKLASEITGARKQSVDDAGHLVPMEKAQEFNRLALDFIQKGQ